MTKRSEDLPHGGGAYALQIELRRPLRLSLGRRRDLRLPAGRYVYCGSAYGPGGLAARIGRHRRRDKPLRWHVDQLTMRGRIIDVLAEVGGRECELVARYAQRPGVVFPLPGFGSSDCRTCASHLLAVPADFAFA